MASIRPCRITLTDMGGSMGYVVVVVGSLHADGEARKEASSDVHEAMTRWVQSGTHVVPEYPCHNPAFRSFSLTTCRFIPFPIYPFLLPLCTKHVARTAIFSLTPNGNKGPMVASGRPRVGTHVPPHPPRATPLGGRRARSRPPIVCGKALHTTL